MCQISNGKEIAHTHTHIPFAYDTCVLRKERSFWHLLVFRIFFLSLFITTINDDRCVCVITSLMCPLAEEIKFYAILTKKLQSNVRAHCNVCSLKRICGRQHLYIFYVYLIVLEWTWVFSLYVKDIIRLIHH